MTILHTPFTKHVCHMLNVQMYAIIWSNTYTIDIDRRVKFISLVYHLCIEQQDYLLSLHRPDVADRFGTKIKNPTEK